MARRGMSSFGSDPRGPALVLVVATGVAAACGGSAQSSSGATGGETSGPGSTSSGTSSGHGGATTSSSSGTGPTSSSGTTTSSSSGSGGATSSSSGSGGAGGAACAAGTLQCNGNTAETCDGKGGFTMKTDCAQKAQLCAPGLGCVTCLPNTGTCNGQVGTGCLPDGSGTVQETCDQVQGTSCNPNTGRCDGACGLAQIGKSYIGCDYWPTVTANMVDDSTFHFAVAVSNTTQSDASVTVTQGANTLAMVMVKAFSVQVIQLPWNLTLKGPYSPFVIDFPGSVQVTQGAFRLRSTQPVTVYQFNPLEYTLNGNFSYTNDASLLLPVNAWTPNYWVAARHHFYVTSGFYAVTAKDDNTTVTVTPGPNGGIVKAGVNGIATNGQGQVVLNAGDVLEVVTDASIPMDQSDPDDVTGTHVQADKPVQVIGGHQCTYIPDSVAACDHLEESMFPEETLATDYIVSAPLIPTGGATPKVEMVRIVATQANTMLTYDPPQAGAPSVIATAGDWVELPDNANDFKISANQPILVAQYMEGQEAGGNSGDPAMALAVATPQYRKDYLFHAPTNYDFSYVNIVAPTGAMVTIDGVMVPANSFTAIGNSGFSVSRQSVSNAGNGNHIAVGNMPFGISVYGYGQYTSYWYPGGSDLTHLH